MLANNSITAAVDAPVCTTPEDIQQLESKLRFTLPFKLDGLAFLFPDSAAAHDARESFLLFRWLSVTVGCRLFSGFHTDSPFSFNAMRVSLRETRVSHLGILTEISTPMKNV